LHHSPENQQTSNGKRNALAALEERSTRRIHKENKRPRHTARPENEPPTCYKRTNCAARHKVDPSRTKGYDELTKKAKRAVGEGQPFEAFGQASCWQFLSARRIRLGAQLSVETKLSAECSRNAHVQSRRNNTASISGWGFFFKATSLTPASQTSAELLLHPKLFLLTSGSPDIGIAS